MFIVTLMFIFNLYLIHTSLLFVLFCFLETGFLCVMLELIVLTRLALDSFILGLKVCIFMSDCLIFFLGRDICVLTVLEISVLLRIILNVDSPNASLPFLVLAFTFSILLCPPLLAHHMPTMCVYHLHLHRDLMEPFFFMLSMDTLSSFETDRRNLKRNFIYRRQQAAFDFRYFG